VSVASDLDGTRERLQTFLRDAAGADEAEIHALERLRGGAIQENWRVEVGLAGGPHAGQQALVVRTDAPSTLEESHSRAHEFAILQVARAAGVRVPEPLWLCEDESVIGRPFHVARHVPGVAAGHLVVRDAAPAGDRAALAEQLGEQLATIHRITPGSAPLDFLEVPHGPPAVPLIARYRRFLDALGDAHPTLEWGLRWCERHCPPRREIVLAHRDYRTGNYLVDDGRLSAILDWEFAGWGDPMEDVAWLCARCWRFGAWQREAGGIADRAPFYRGYERASGRRIDPASVHFWEVMAHVRWAIIALHQAERHASGVERSLELALTGRIAGECELEVLLLTEPSGEAAA